jgi:hypothetical protein
MNLYGSLLDSMLAWCEYSGLRRGPVLTLSMLALGLGGCLNVLSVIDVLWSLGILANPYQSNGELRPQHYVCALLCIAFVLNTILARRRFSVHGNRVPLRQPTASRVAAPAYVLVSTGVFLITLLPGPP